jgi:high-affinity iron transporter
LFSNFLIGLREGLEAALIVGILIAYAKKIGRSDWKNKILLGVGAAIVVSILAGLLLNWLVEDTEAGTNQIISGSASAVAVGFVTWMIFWMSKNARNLSGDVQSRLNAAAGALTVVGIAFFSVIREGIETSIFLWSSVNASGQGYFALLGALLGFGVSGWLGYLIYRRALKLNLGTFFKYTGAFLIIVAAGILGYAVAEFQEVGLLPILTEKAYDLTAWAPDGSWQRILLSGTISFNPAPSLLESTLWVIYVSTVGYFFARAYRKPKTTK